MANTDVMLGRKIHKMLKEVKYENPINFENYKSTGVHNLEGSLETFCTNLGLDLQHPSTKGTPHRLAKMYKHEICWGLDYENFPACMKVENEGDFNEMIIIRNIEVKSLCEHHFQPIIGKAHIAYIPEDSLLGLSKFNRIVEFFSRRPQLQERLCAQIQQALKYILGTEHVAVIIEAEHFCVKFRGIEDQCSDTITSKVSGNFRENAECRAELFSLINSRRT